jgi:uncharacterized protein YhhL (DUF1145 family)
MGPKIGSGILLFFPFLSLQIGPNLKFWRKSVIKNFLVPFPYTFNVFLKVTPQTRVNLHGCR